MIDRLKVYLDWWSGLEKSERDRFNTRIRVNDIDIGKKNEIKELAKYFLSKQVSFTCGSCLMDSHFLLLRLNIEKMSQAHEYSLVVGTFLHDPIGKVFDLILSPPKLTEELALYHLAFNPAARKYFVRLPSDIGKRIAEYLQGMDSEMQSKATDWARYELDTYLVSLREKEKKENNQTIKTASKENTAAGSRRKKKDSSDQGGE